MNVLHTRRERASALIRTAGLDAAAFVPGPNFHYLTGVSLHLMERPTLFVLGADGAMLAVMPALERQKWSTAMTDVETFYWDDADGPDAAFARLAAALGAEATLGVEGLRMRAAEYLALARHLPGDRLADADPALVSLRMVKDADEVADLHRAIEISETALAEVLEGGIEGRTEAAIARRLMAAMLGHGADGAAFDTIVLAGGRAANPHGDAGDVAVRPGDVLLIDFGARFGAMNADITRSVFCDHVPETHRAIHDTVLAANAAGRAAVRPGAAVGEVDVAASNVLAASAFAEMILHKTGHGLGRDVHEAPQVIHTDTTPMQAGMIFTVEPGLYRAGHIGVRIEDDMLVTADGGQSLTSFPREARAYP